MGKVLKYIGAGVISAAALLGAAYIGLILSQKNWTNRGNAVGEVVVYSSIGMSGRQVERICITSSFPIPDVSTDEVEFVNCVTPNGDKTIATAIGVENNTLTLEVAPFVNAGETVLFIYHKPWSVKFKNHPELNFSVEDINRLHTSVVDDCIRSSLTYAGITREYILYLPQNEDGSYKNNVPLMVWNIGGTEYGLTADEMIDANTSLVTMHENGVDCGVLITALDNPNYEYSASLEPEKIELIDRNNALQAEIIKNLIADGTVDGDHIYCVGASSGGGATMRFCMQFPELFAAAVPICSMDPIVPIHHVNDKTIEDFTAELVDAFEGQVYRWNGTDMELSDIDTAAFISLPVYFAHAENDKVCKSVSSKAMYAARQKLGSENDRIRIHDDEYMERFGVTDTFKHASWIPALSEFDADSPMGWMLSH